MLVKIKQILLFLFVLGMLGVSNMPVFAASSEQTVVQKKFVCCGSDTEIHADLVNNMKKLDEKISKNGEKSIQIQQAKYRSSQEASFMSDSKLMPSIGNVKMLVVMVEFSDVSFQNDFTVEHVENMMFGEENSSSLLYPKESVRAWYQRSSYGKLNISGNVKKIKMNHTKDYYTTNGENNPDGEDLYRDELWTKVKNLGISWDEYDSNQDEYIDSICFYVAGDSDSWASQWWSHALYGSSKNVDDVYKVGYYAECIEDLVLDLGATVAIHEIGHCLGLPDLYNTLDSCQISRGIYSADMMSNNTGDFNALSKIFLGWIDEENIHIVKYGTSVAQLSLESYAKTGDCAILFVEDSQSSLFGEYYLIQFLDLQANNTEYGYLAGNVKNHLQIYHVNAELDEQGKYFLYDNQWNGENDDCKLIEAVHKDAEKYHGEAWISSWMKGSNFLPLLQENYECGFITGDEFTPYTTPSTGKYAADRKYYSADEFSGLHITNIRVGDNVSTMDVSFETEAKENHSLSFSVLGDVISVDTNKMKFQVISNHDIWLTGANVNAYLRKKGETEKYVDIIVDTKYVWPNYKDYCNGNYSFQIMLDEMDTLESDTEYEIVFPKGMFITSYGKVSDEIVISGIHTLIDIWNGNEEMEIVQNTEEYKGVLDMSDECVAIDGITINRACLMEDGSIQLFKMNAETGTIISKEIILEGNLNLISGRIRSFGKNKDGYYWIAVNTKTECESADLIYLLDAEKKIIKVINDPRASDTYSIRSLGSEFAILEQVNDNNAYIINLLTGNLIELEVSSDTMNIEGVFLCGSGFLVAESLNSDKTRWEYTIRDEKNKVLRALDFDGMQIIHVSEEESGYLFMGMYQNNVVAMHTDSNFILKNFIVIQTQEELLRVMPLSKGWLLYCKNQYGTYYGIYDNNFSLYTKVTFKWGHFEAYNITELVDGEKFFLLNTFDSLFQFSDEIEIPELMDKLSQIEVSPSVVLNEEGYVEQGDYKTILEYVQSIKSEEGEGYLVKVFNNQYYLEISNAEKTAMLYYPMKNCLHKNKKVTVEAVESTCEKRGHTEELQCEDCGIIVQKSEQLQLKMHDFKFDRYEKEPTCLEPHGSGYIVCNVCGVEEMTGVTTLSGHQWDRYYTIDREATETQEGIKSIHCSLCGEIREGSEILIPLIKNEEEIVATPTPTPTLSPSPSPTTTPTPVSPTPIEITTEQAKTDIKAGDRIKDKKSSAIYRVIRSEKKRAVVEYVKAIGNKTKTTKVIVPNRIKINGIYYKVTSIKENAFKDLKKLKQISIGKNIEKISKNTFKRCKTVKVIVINSSKLKPKGIAKSAFSGLNKKVKIKVPKGKMKKYRKLFKKKGLDVRVKVVALT